MLPEFRRSSKISKSDAAIANIPCSINILEKDVSKNPKSYIMVQVKISVTKESGKPTHRQSIEPDLQSHQPYKVRSLARQAQD